MAFSVFPLLIFPCNASLSFRQRRPFRGSESGGGECTPSLRRLLPPITLIIREGEKYDLVYRLVNSLMHRERRCAAPARRATEDVGGHSWVIRRENQECPPCCKKRNEAGARGLSPEGSAAEAKRMRRQTAKDDRA